MMPHSLVESQNLEYLTSLYDVLVHSREFIRTALIESSDHNYTIFFSYHLITFVWLFFIFGCLLFVFVYIRLYLFFYIYFFFILTCLYLILSIHPFILIYNIIYKILLVRSHVFFLFFFLHQIYCNGADGKPRQKNRAKFRRPRRITECRNIKKITAFGIQADHSEVRTSKATGSICICVCM